LETELPENSHKVYPGRFGPMSARAFATLGQENDITSVYPEYLAG